MNGGALPQSPAQFPRLPEFSDKQHPLRQPRAAHLASWTQTLPKRLHGRYEKLTLRIINRIPDPKRFTLFPRRNLYLLETPK
jgi:hypothetical protein